MSVVDAVRCLLKAAMESSRRRTWSVMMGELVLRLANVALLFVLYGFAVALTSDAGSATPWLLAVASLTTVLWLGAGLTARWRLSLHDAVAAELQHQVAASLAAPITLDHLLREDITTKAEHVRDRGRAIGSAFGATVVTAATLFEAAALLAVLLAVDPIFLIAAVAAVPLIAVRALATRVDVPSDGEQRSRQRVQRILDLTGSLDAVTELRQAQAWPWLLERSEQQLDQHADERADRLTRHRSHEAAGWLLVITVLAALILWPATGSPLAGPGGLVFVFALSRAAAIADTAGDFLRWFRRSIPVLEDLLDLNDLVATGNPTGPTAAHVADEANATRAAANHGAGAAGSHDRSPDIELRAATFHYPGADGAALRDVDLRLAAGTTVAIVGANGAGKSTLASMILGLLTPTSGARTGPRPAAGEVRAAAVFQGFARPRLTVRDAVGVSDPGAATDAVVRSAIDWAGGPSLLTELPPLERWLDPEDGAGLSGGQWQLLALARARNRRDPQLLVLDEPSAHLDPERARSLRLRLADLATTAASQDAVIVLITHSLALARSLDLILVVERGRICERGTHEQLLAEDGRYASMWREQAGPLPATGRPQHA